MEFRKYQHVERYGVTEVDGIEIGTCYVFPKIDGTNSSVWLGEDWTLRAGSRTRELTTEADNAGFYAAISQDDRVKSFLQKYPNHRLFGEWLVPHSLRTYRDDAWRKFYVFDVCLDTDNETGLEYIPYDIYKPWLDEFEIDYLAPIAIIKNGNYENFIRCLEQNVFLVKDGSGVGEGVVIKNYDFYNKFGRQTWAKIVTSEFKEKHHKEMGAPVFENKVVEQGIVDKYVTSALVDKEYSKITVECDGWSSRLIPRLLSQVFYALVTEEMWNIVKEFKNPKVDFKMLNAITIGKIKMVKPELFA